MSEAKKIIHLGATSCFVTDNADLIMLRSAMQLVRTKAVELISVLSQKVFPLIITFL